LIEADETLDVRNKVCPMPVLLTRRKLEALEPGKVLRVVGDYPASKDNICRYAEDNSYEIQEVVEEKSQYEIFIRKR